MVEMSKNTRAVEKNTDWLAKFGFSSNLSEENWWHLGRVVLFVELSRVTFEGEI